MFSICFTLAAVLGTTFLTQFAAAQEQPQLVVATPRPLITEALDESRLTVLKGNTHPLARREFDLGTAPASLPMERMLLVLKRSDEQETALRKLLDDQQDKNSPHYHKWVTPEQFGAQFGPTDADMQMITIVAAVARLPGGIDQGTNRAGVLRLGKPGAGGLPHQHS